MAVHGVITAKFALHAGMLLISARIDAHSATVVLDPSIPISVASDDVARRLGVSSGKDDAQAIARKRVIGIESTSVRLRTVRHGAVPPPAAMIVGNDVLRGAPILLDFASDRLHLPERGDARHIEARMQSLPASVTPDGCFSFVARDAAGQPVRVALVGTPSDLRGRTGDVALADFKVEATYDNGARCPSSQALVGWDAFKGRRVLIDIAGGKLWLS